METPTEVSKMQEAMDAFRAFYWEGHVDAEIFKQAHKDGIITAEQLNYILRVPGNVTKVS